jgi:hypothetical protein
MSEPGEPPPRPPRDPSRTIGVVAVVGIVVTVLVTAALSLQEATDPTRSASVPWGGVVVLVAAIGGVGLVIASRRK